MMFFFIFSCFWMLSDVYGSIVLSFGPGNEFMCHCNFLTEQCDEETGSCTSGCHHEWFGPGCQYRNLAKLKGSTVSQTNTKDRRNATLAIDGYDHSCSSTKPKSESPYWKVLLPHNETITELYIKTSTRGQETFASKKGLVSVEYVTKDENTETMQSSKVCHYMNNSIPKDKSFVVKCLTPLVGNQVKIQLDGNARLVLCDVKINGGRNLAFLKSSNQSSILHNSSPYSSTLAVDGNLTTCSWTDESDSNSSWTLQLGHKATVQYIIIYTDRDFRAKLVNDGNMTDYGFDKIQGHESYVSTSMYSEVTGMYIYTDPKRNYNMKRLCEVELYGDCVENMCGFDCKIECLSNNMTIWEKMSTNHTSGCKACKDKTSVDDCGNNCDNCQDDSCYPVTVTSDQGNAVSDPVHSTPEPVINTTDPDNGTTTSTVGRTHTVNDTSNPIDSTPEPVVNTTDPDHGTTKSDVGRTHTDNDTTNPIDSQSEPVVNTTDPDHGTTKSDVGRTHTVNVSAQRDIVLAGPTIPVFIGAGVFLLLGVILIILFDYIGRRKRRAESGDAEGRTRNGEERNIFWIAEQTFANSIYTKVFPKDETLKSKSGVQVHKLLQYVKLSLSSKEHITSEFKTIPQGLQYSTETASLPENIDKNRYQVILPYDHSRVVLSTLPGKPNSDYINASYIKGHFKTKAYIAAQGPMKTSIDDFWRMIWENDIRTIAMLSNLTEEKTVTCSQYWGTPNTRITYGYITVHCESEQSFAEHTERIFNVFYKNDRDHERTVTQFQYTAWPDKGVPRSTSSLVQFLHVVRQMDSCKSHTWLVHCSNGIGRTGTFIAMDILYDEGEDLGTVDILRCVQALREQRVDMVQTKDQYKLLHGVMVELLVFPSKQVHVHAFSTHYANLQNIQSGSIKSELLLQYEELHDEITFINHVIDSTSETKGSAKDDLNSAAKLNENKRKNRNQNLIPRNEFRPRLSTTVPGRNDYINAVYVQSFCSSRGYIMTQIPTKETAIDCCRLVIEEGIKVIVSFDGERTDINDVGQYLPEHGSIQLGPFTCTKISETDESFYLVRIHRIVYYSGETLVHQLIFKNWPTKRIIPSDYNSMLQFLQFVEFLNKREAGKSVLVQCLNGAERSGLFVVLMNIMEQIKHESRVSIPYWIRCAMIRREQIIPHYEQYQFCYDIVLSFVENNSTYMIMRPKLEY